MRQLRVLAIKLKFDYRDYFVRMCLRAQGEVWTLADYVAKLLLLQAIIRPLLVKLREDETVENEEVVPVRFLWTEILRGCPF